MSNPRAFWEEQASSIHWERQFTNVLDTSKPPFYRWFVGGVTNTCYNAVDRHVEAGRGGTIAVRYMSAVTGMCRTLTYAQLQEQVAKLAGVLHAQSVNPGDRVVIYMPMIVETLIAMLACARIGAVHSVVFGGFAAHELAMRIDSAKPKVILAGNAGMEGVHKVVWYRPLLEAALAQCSHRVSSVIMYNRDVPHSVEPPRTSSPGGFVTLDWQREVEAATPRGCEWVDASHPQYIIYTSGSTGTPKGVVRDTGGHAVALTWSMRNVYGCSHGDVWWAASDPAWVVGASYMVYAPLLAGITTCMLEGKPVGTPDADTFWRMCRTQGVTHMFCAPTAMRAIKKERPQTDTKVDTGSLRTLFLAGERTDPNTLSYTRALTGVPVVDHYWQTEFGWPVLSNMALHDGFAPIASGSVGYPVPGWDLRVQAPEAVAAAAGSATTAEAEFFATRTEAQLRGTVRTPHARIHAHAVAGVDATALPVDHHARVHSAPALTEARTNELGPLLIRLPLPPGALIGLHEDEARFKKSYTDAHPGYFATGDAAYVDDEGRFHIMTRIDDVINVAGHRLSTGAIEAAISSHPQVAECACVGAHDDMKGQVPVAFIVLKLGVAATAHGSISQECVARVRSEIGPVAAFKTVVIVPRVPKTRSGKTLRATLKAMADGVPFKMPPTIEDASVLDEVRVALAGSGLGVRTSSDTDAGVSA